MYGETTFYNQEELDELFPDQFLEKSEAMKRSPGHLSVASCDSGIAGNISPNRSLPDLDSGVFCLQDLIEEEEDGLQAYLLSSVNQPGPDQVPSSTSIENQSLMDTSTTVDDNVSVGDVNDLLSLPDIDQNKDDLAVFLESLTAVASRNQVSDQQQIDSPKLVDRPRRSRPVRATRSGKTVVLRHEESTSTKPGHSTRATLNKTGSRKLAKQAPQELEHINIDDVDPSQKNAIQARINRQKKKVYIQSLEEQVETLSKENEILKKDNKKCTKERDTLQEELKYYKNVLANDSQLAGLLQNIGNVKNVRLTTSFEMSRKRGFDNDHDYSQGPASKKRKGPDNEIKMSGGVCLHVEKDNVSLEFCSKCSRMAVGAGREIDS